MKLNPFVKATAERMVRAGVAAEVAVYLAGNLVFDTTNVGGSIENIIAIFVGGAVSALALSLGVQVTRGNGPALTSAEQVVPEPPEPPSQP